MAGGPSVKMLAAVATLGPYRHLPDPPLFTDLLDQGVLVMTGGSTLRLYPPLTATTDELDQAADTLAKVLAAHNALAES